MSRRRFEKGSLISASRPAIAAGRGIVGARRGVDLVGLGGGGAVVLAALVLGAVWVVLGREPGDARSLRRKAVGESRRELWREAAADWAKLNRTKFADASSHTEEARAWLALDHAGKAERALAKALAGDAGDATGWLLEFEILRVEDRVFEALALADRALASVAPEERVRVLRAATIVALDEYPEVRARERLERWLAADGEDRNARVSLLRLMAAMPMAGDPDRDQRIDQLTAILHKDATHIGAREALVNELAGAGEPKAGRRVLDEWPRERRNALFDRLDGRWRLDYEHDLPGAVASFEKALADWPHDWRTWYRLGRAQTALGATDAAKSAVDRVTALRELLDPARLGPRLSADLTKLDQPSARIDLMELCSRVGLDRLARAWKREAETSLNPPARSEHPRPVMITLPSEGSNARCGGNE